ncbi:MAG: hypothetical protein J4G11_00040 [Acidimicrobiia bacterium]|nr:hypothetical protein [Acidimicrobiia bacterium]
MPHVMTVRGPILPSELGPTMTHEHVFLDGRHAWGPSEEILDTEAGTRPFETRLAGPSRWNQSAYRSNLAQTSRDDYQLISDEVGEYVRAGGGTIVELTVIGLNPEPEALARLSEDLDVHIVAGAGFYVSAFHPSWVAGMSLPDLTAFLRKEVAEGIGGTRVRPGIIGEIGTSETLFDVEERVLRASARVAVETDTPINVHCHPPSLEVVQRILDILEEEGHPLDRTSLSHLDEITDLDYHRAVLGRGPLIGFDSFGQDGYFEPTWKSKSDQAKLETMLALVEAGFENQLLMSQDMHKKHYLLRYGGLGYNHVLTRVVPRMKVTYGADDRLIEKLLVTNPTRLLTRNTDSGQPS